MVWHPPSFYTEEALNLRRAARAVRREVRVRKQVNGAKVKAAIKPRDLSPERYLFLLNEIGLTKTALAELLGCDRHTVFLWVVPPGYAFAYLELLRQFMQIKIFEQANLGREFKEAKAEVQAYLKLLQERLKRDKLPPPSVEDWKQNWSS